MKYLVGKETREYTYNRPFSYDPTVTIMSCSGKNVGDGMMPFG